VEKGLSVRQAETLVAALQKSDKAEKPSAQTAVDYASVKAPRPHKATRTFLFSINDPPFYTLPMVTTSMALMVRIRFSASSKTRDAHQGTHRR